MNQEANSIQSPGARIVASGGVNEQGEHCKYIMLPCHLCILYGCWIVDAHACWVYTPL